MKTTKKKNAKKKLTSQTKDTKTRRIGYKCGTCGTLGHNSRTCGQPPSPATVAGPVMVPLSKLRPHAQNPRLVLRQDVIDRIADQIRLHGLHPSHALVVRGVDGGYEIIGGHHRTLAAEKAGLVDVPAWVREMSDAEAVMALVLDNTQGELSPLEIGFHALNVVQPAQGKAGEGLAAYADAIGRSKQQVTDLRHAAEVANLSGQPNKFLSKASHLSEIYRAPQSDWKRLCDGVLEQGWTTKQVRAEVEAALARGREPSANMATPVRRTEPTDATPAPREQPTPRRPDSQVEGEVVEELRPPVAGATQPDSEPGQQRDVDGKPPGERRAPRSKREREPDLDDFVKSVIALNRCARVLTTKSVLTHLAQISILRAKDVEGLMSVALTLSALLIDGNVAEAEKRAARLAPAQSSPSTSTEGVRA